MSKLLENLNVQQTEAVKHTTGPLLIVAGAGTGKTTVITRRIAYLTEQGLARPDEILALTFTEKAATEMQERADLLLPLGYFDSWICTFHGFCERVLKNHALDIGIPNDFELLDEVRQWILIYKNFDKFNLDYYRPLGSPHRFIDALLSHFSRCKDEMVSPSDYLKFAEEKKLRGDSVEGIKKPGEDPAPEFDTAETARIDEVANAYHTYQKLLLDNNYLDFGDLINSTIDLFKKRPKILQFYQQKFKFILVDEFQDTNLAQFELVKLLAGQKKNLVVVGDDDQSIYKFRGASVSNILKFRDEFPNARLVTLTENYRSSQNILDLAYNFIQANNPDRLEVKLNINKKLTNPLAVEGNIKILEGEDLSDELNCVAKEIVTLKNASADITWNDFAILIRANSAADELLPVLQAHGLPFTFVANKGLYKKPIVVDILSYLRVLDNINDSGSLYRVLTLPKFHLELEELSKLLEYAHEKTLSLFEVLKIATTFAEIGDTGKKKIQSLLDCLSRHAALNKTYSASEMIVEIVRDLSFEQKLKVDTAQNAENRELLEQFYKKTEDFEKTAEHKNVHEFLEFLSLEAQAGSEGQIQFDPNLGPESIKVLTIHSAKGLEFKYVFIINMVDQRFPTRERKETIEIPSALIKDILPEGDFHLEEERRLFYVALTRAKQGLYFSWAKNYGGARAKKPSQFLLETGLVPSDKVSKATGKVIFSAATKKEQVYQKLPKSFSYSALKDFEMCPLKYKYCHYLKLPVRGSHQQSFGITIHCTFEAFLKRYKQNLEMTQTDLFGHKPSAAPLPGFEELEKLYEKYWIDSWYKNKTEKEKYRQEGKEMIKIFYESIKTLPPQPVFVEQSFKLPLGEYEFRGKIDRADKEDGGLKIIDYKTGKTPKSKTDLDQLHIYQWAAENLGHKVNKMQYWYLLDNNIVEEKLATPERLTELKEELLDIIHQIVDAVKFDRFKELHKKTRDHKCQFEDLE